MNYLQRFSAALAAREERQHGQDSPAPDAGEPPTHEVGVPPDQEWLSEIQAVARQLPARGRKQPGSPGG